MIEVIYYKPMAYIWIHGTLQHNPSTNLAQFITTLKIHEMKEKCGICAATIKKHQNLNAVGLTSFWKLCMVSAQIQHTPT